jgi:hypothetical protein
MILKMTIEIELDDTLWGFTDDEKIWMENEVFVGDGSLIMHSNEIGDEVGVIKSVKNITYTRSLNTK